MHYVFRSTTLYLSNHEAEYSSKNAYQRTVSAAETPVEQVFTPLTETRAEVGNLHVLHIHVK